jgi:hypothetical protein
MRHPPLSQKTAESVDQGRRPKVTRLPTNELHEKFIAAVGESVIGHTDIRKKPLEVDLNPPLPAHLRIYLYNMTAPPGGRTIGEHKIQVILPGQKPKQSGKFDDSDGRLVILAGYMKDKDVFVFWDAGMYSRIRYSRNVQVSQETVARAFAGFVATQERTLRGRGVETVVAANSGNVIQALITRRKLTIERLMRD